MSAVRLAMARFESKRPHGSGVTLPISEHLHSQHSDVGGALSKDGFAGSSTFSSEEGPNYVHISTARLIKSNNTNTGDSALAGTSAVDADEKGSREDIKSTSRSHGVTDTMKVETTVLSPSASTPEVPTAPWAVKLNSVSKDRSATGARVEVQKCAVTDVTSPSTIATKQESTPPFGQSKVSLKNPTTPTTFGTTQRHVISNATNTVVSERIQVTETTRSSAITLKQESTTRFGQSKASSHSTKDSFATGTTNSSSRDAKPTAIRAVTPDKVQVPEPTSPSVISAQQQSTTRFGQTKVSAYSSKVVPFATTTTSATPHGVIPSPVNAVVLENVHVNPSMTPRLRFNRDAHETIGGELENAHKAVRVSSPPTHSSKHDHPASNTTTPNPATGVNTILRAGNTSVCKDKNKSSTENEAPWKVSLKKVAASPTEAPSRNAVSQQSKPERPRDHLVQPLVAAGAHKIPTTTKEAISVVDLRSRIRGGETSPAENSLAHAQRPGKVPNTGPSDSTCGTAFDTRFQSHSRDQPVRLRPNSGTSISVPAMEQKSQGKSASDSLVKKGGEKIKMSENVTFDTKQYNEMTNRNTNVDHCVMSAHDRRFTKHSGTEQSSVNSGSEGQRIVAPSMLDQTKIVTQSKTSTKDCDQEQFLPNRVRPPTPERKYTIPAEHQTRLFGNTMGTVSTQIPSVLPNSPVRGIMARQVPESHERLEYRGTSVKEAPSVSREDTLEAKKDGDMLHNKAAINTATKETSSESERQQSSAISPEVDVQANAKHTLSYLSKSSSSGVLEIEARIHNSTMMTPPVDSSESRNSKQKSAIDAYTKTNRGLSKDTNMHGKQPTPTKSDYLVKQPSLNINNEDNSNIVRNTQLANTVLTNKVREPQFFDTRVFQQPEHIDQPATKRLASPTPTNKNQHHPKEERIGVKQESVANVSNTTTTRSVDELLTAAPSTQGLLISSAAQHRISLARARPRLSVSQTTAAAAKPSKAKPAAPSDAEAKAKPATPAAESPPKPAYTKAAVPLTAAVAAGARVHMRHQQPLPTAAAASVRPKSQVLPSSRGEEMSAISHHSKGARGRATTPTPTTGDEKNVIQSQPNNRRGNLSALLKNFQ